MQWFILLLLHLLVIVTQFRVGQSLPGGHTCKETGLPLPSAVAEGALEELVAAAPWPGAAWIQVSSLPAQLQERRPPAERAGRRKALLDLEAEVARAAGSEDADNRTASNQNFISTVSGLISTLTAELRRVADESQALIQSSHGAIAQCEAAKDAAVGLASRVETAFTAKSREHAACLGQEGLLEESVQFCRQVVSLREESRRDHCGKLKTANGNSPVPTVCQKTASGDFEQQLVRMQLLLDGSLTDLRGKKQNCSQAIAAVANATADCDAKVLDEARKEGNCTALALQMDQLSCAAGTRRKGACTTAAACRAQSVARYNSDSANVRAEEASLKADVTIARHVQCLVGLLSRGVGGNRSAVHACMAAPVDTSDWDIAYPAVPQAGQCALASTYPCNDAYLDANYGSSAVLRQRCSPCAALQDASAASRCGAFACPVHYAKASGSETVEGATKEACCRIRPSVSAMVHVSGFVSAAGEVHMVGSNPMGALADGSHMDRRTPVRAAGLGAAVHVAGGVGFSVFVMADGTAMAAGRNDKGQLGSGSQDIMHLTPVKVLNLNGVVDAAAGRQHVVYLLGDGTVWGAGSHADGCLGDVTGVDRAAPWQIRGLASKVKGITCGAWFSTFLMEDGSVRSTGRNAYGQFGDGSAVNSAAPVAMSGVSTAVQVSAGYHHLLVLLADGTVVATGLGTDGQRGDGTSTEMAKNPVVVQEVRGVTQVSAGSHNSFFLLNDGSVMGTGYNGQGQLGDGTEVNKLSPVRVAGVAGVVQVSSGKHGDAPHESATLAKDHVLFLLADGSVRAAGDNSFGGLGDGSGDLKVGADRPATVRASESSSSPLMLN